MDQPTSVKTAREMGKQHVVNAESKRLQRALRSFIYPVPAEALGSYIQDPRTAFSLMCIALISRSALPQHGRAADAGAADLQTLPRRSPMSAERRNRYSQLPSKLRRSRIPLDTPSTTYYSSVAGHETNRAQPNPSRLTEWQSNSHQIC